LQPLASSLLLSHCLGNTCRLAAIQDNKQTKNLYQNHNETVSRDACTKLSGDLFNLNDPDTEEGFNAEESKSNEVECLQTKLY
jgi:hypothetical protein